MYKKAAATALIGIVSFHGIAWEYYDNNYRRTAPSQPSDSMGVWLDSDPPRFPPHLKALGVFSGETHRAHNPKAVAALNNLPPELQIIRFYGNSNCHTKLPENLPDSIKEITYYECQIHKLPPPPMHKWPASLTKLKLSYNTNLHEIQDVLPDSLQTLDLSPDNLFKHHNRSNIKTIARFPPNLTYIDVSGNQLKTLPELPAGLRVLICDENPIEYLPDLPPSLEKLTVRYNRALYKNYPLLNASNNFIDGPKDEYYCLFGEPWWCYAGDKQMKRVIAYVNTCNAERLRQGASDTPATSPEPSP